jgi:hypothetical protein
MAKRKPKVRQPQKPKTDLRLFDEAISKMLTPPVRDTVSNRYGNSSLLSSLTGPRKIEFETHMRLVTRNLPYEKGDQAWQSMESRVRLLRAGQFDLDGPSDDTLAEQAMHKQRQEQESKSK